MNLDIDYIKLVFYAATIGFIFQISSTLTEVVIKLLVNAYKEWRK